MAGPIRRGPMRAATTRPKAGKPVPPNPLAHNLLAAYQAAFHEWEEIAGYSPRTITHQRFAIARFIQWCDDRGLARPQDITRPILERYQRAVYHHRKHNGQPLSVAAQLGLLLPLQAWFKWLTRQNHLLYNPAADLDLPRKPKTLPKGLLTVAEVESVLNQADATTDDGIRARAILETLYSTGIRRMEVVNLKLHDVDCERGALMVRLGKGAKDRLVPIGARACAWVAKYRDEVRPLLASGHDEHTLFLDDDGLPFEPGKLGNLVKCHLEEAGITQPGACHLFRHACATHMLENGADIRFIQAMLGHEKLTTTQIYAQVSLTKLKEIHEATHPARLTRQPKTASASGRNDQNEARQALLDTLRDEADDDESITESRS
jgi:integrase/recombinase XerD